MFTDCLISARHWAKYKGQKNEHDKHHHGHKICPLLPTEILSLLGISLNNRVSQEPFPNVILHLTSSSEEALLVTHSWLQLYKTCRNVLVTRGY